MAEDKQIAVRPKWDDQSDRRFFVFTVPLILPTTGETGFELRGKVSKQHIDRDALFQLEYARGGRDRTELSRCQWRPFEVHQNKNWGPTGYELATFRRESHWHTFSDNYLPEEGRMRAGSLPAAVPVHPDPSTLSDFIAFSGECFRIKNIALIDVPSMSPDMFWVKI